MFLLLTLFTLLCNAGEPTSTWAKREAPRSKRLTGTGEIDSDFSPPKEGLVISIINKMYRWTRLFDRINEEDREGNLGFISGSNANHMELWQLEEQGDNEWFIRNVGSKRIISGQGDSYTIVMSPESQVGLKNVFKVVPVPNDDGWYYLESAAYKGRYIAADYSGTERTDLGFLWDPEQAHVCVEDGLDGQICEWNDAPYDEMCGRCKHGVREAGNAYWCCHPGDLWQYDDCACAAQNNAPPKVLRDAYGNPDDRFRWRFEDLYRSKTSWEPVWRFENAQPCEVPITKTYTKGYSESYEDTTANKEGVSVGVSVSAGIAIEAADFGMSMSNNVYNEVSASVTNANKGTYEEKVTTQYNIPGNQCMRLLQVKIGQEDTFGGGNIYFRGESDQRYECCEPGCPKLDPDLDMSVCGDEAEAINVVEPEAYHSMALYGLAVFGFGVVAYGAVMHYTAKPAYEEVTPLHP